MDELTVQARVQSAIGKIKSGDRKAGGEILLEVLKENPRNEVAWLWLSACFDDLDKRRKCLQKALEINPNNAAAARGLERLKTPVEELEEDIKAQPVQPANVIASTTNEEEAPGTWYQSYFVKVLTFLFLWPVWVLIIWTDKRETKRVKGFSLIWAGLMVMFCVAIAAISHPDMNLGFNRRTVEYRVYGDHITADIGYADENQSLLQTHSMLPWNMKFKMKKGNVVGIVALGNYISGNITCEVWVDGQIMISQTGHQGYPASCKGQIP